jgi:hypothetical protein
MVHGVGQRFLHDARQLARARAHQGRHAGRIDDPPVQRDATGPQRRFQPVAQRGQQQGQVAVGDAERVHRQAHLAQAGVQRVHHLAAGQLAPAGQHLGRGELGAHAVVHLLQQAFAFGRGAACTLADLQASY